MNVQYPNLTYIDKIRNIVDEEKKLYTVLDLPTEPEPEPVVVQEPVVPKLEPVAEPAELKIVEPELELKEETEKKPTQKFKMKKRPPIV